ncbi:alpha/beta fold hydrolase [Chengkuizengella sediminis]|uniref:alpha/beta fold hydrolase n=1 Tax=Chengkuizengella sediminis TaxID=1885917 RepID=UPI00138A4650|nr:alpha/beta hydrolase [Chengkuizengella sediminis]
MKQSYIQFGGNIARIHEWGDKNNPQIICFHGLGGTSLSFIEIAESLKHKYHILSFDLPGHGKSSAFKTDEEYGADYLVNWVIDVIERIGNDSFHILAHSWGASVALHYAAEYPEKVDKMLLLDGGYHDFEMEYVYFTELVKSKKIGYKPMCSLEEMITWYEKDFDEFIFDDKSSFLEAEKANHRRTSQLREVAIYDLMREEGSKIHFHATGDTARGVIKFQYHSQQTLKFSQLKSDILLIYVDLPDHYFDIRKVMVKTFEQKVKVTTKAYRDTTHMVHWDRPHETIEDIKNWFK